MELEFFNKNILNPSEHPVGEDSGHATITRQWLLEKRDKSGEHAIVRGSHLDFYICAAEAFPKIVDDISKATKSVDLICFGFDPAMEVGSRSGNHWPRGKRYGDLLLDVANRGVTVRLLVWFAGDGHVSEAVGRMANNLPGHPAWPRSSDKTSPAYELNRYRQDWWDNAMGENSVMQNRFSVCPTLYVRHRVLLAIDTLLTVGPSELTLIQKESLSRIGTHHQKPILIDYEDPAKAVGYVMGLNSLTDYWDTPHHTYDDPLRGKSWEGEADTKHPELGLKPYRDYAIRVEGQALEDLNRNFVVAWDIAETDWNLYFQDNGSLMANRLHIKKDSLVARGTPNCDTVQIVRTDAVGGDQTIQEVYWLATNQVRNYLYIENQYFQNEEWAKWLKERRKIYQKGLKAWGGMKASDMPLLHVFIVIPEPEKDGMVPATYDTIASLGRGEQMGNYDANVKEVRSLGSSPDDGTLERATKFLTNIGLSLNPAARYLLNDIKNSAQKPLVTSKQLEAMGIKVLIAKLYTQSDTSAASREIYIHSKLMMADDVFFTLGSANLNVRSMCCDGEINIAGTDKGFIKDMRQRVWGNIAGELDGGDGSLKTIKQMHKDWIKKMQLNADVVQYKVGRLDSHIVTFSDERGVTFSPRLSQGPVSDNTVNT